MASNFSYSLSNTLSPTIINLTHGLKVEKRQTPIYDDVILSPLRDQDIISLYFNKNLIH